LTLVRACDKSEVSVGRLKFVQVAGKDLVIVNLDGKFYAMDNWCTHEQGNLSDGELEKNVLTCPEHEAKFDVKTGKVVMGPDGTSPDTVTSERAYKIVIQGNDLMVEIS
jgi:nitrite reductase/ring-hydroxylating ferredoxin subunit